MITRTPPLRQASRWQRALAQAITDPRELLERLDLDPALLPAALEGAHEFRLLAPRGYVARMRVGDPNDPLLRQVLPLGAELEERPGFINDPLGERTAMAGPGLLHKYQGRALLITTGACAVHCRYCFRRHFPYGESRPAQDSWREVAQYLSADTSISELILSGGDPLILNDVRLHRLGEALAPIRHLRRLRIHTRLPIVLPERIDKGFMDWVGSLRQQVIVVVHANHAHEIDARVTQALEQLRGAGVTLLNQAVMLKGVNDRVDDQVALCEALFTAGVLPYYLHLLDRVRGAAHFEVEEPRVRSIVKGMSERLPGYLLPRLVREEAGKRAKTPVPLLDTSVMGP